MMINYNYAILTDAKNNIFLFNLLTLQKEPLIKTSIQQNESKVYKKLRVLELVYYEILKEQESFTKYLVKVPSLDIFKKAGILMC